MHLRTKTRENEFRWANETNCCASPPYAEPHEKAITEIIARSTAALQICSLGRRQIFLFVAENYSGDRIGVYQARNRWALFALAIGSIKEFVFPYHGARKIFRENNLILLTSMFALSINNSKYERSTLNRERKNRQFCHDSGNDARSLKVSWLSWWIRSDSSWTCRSLSRRTSPKNRQLERRKHIANNYRNSSQALLEGSFN